MISIWMQILTIANPALIPLGYPSLRVKFLILLFFVFIVGVLGPGSSSVTEDVQNMLSQFQIPQVGYSATSITLSNTHLYPYFLRVVPPDSEQAQALADLTHSFGWKYISTVHTDGKLITSPYPVYTPPYSVPPLLTLYPPFLTCIHPSLPRIHPSLPCIYPSLPCIHPSLSCIHLSLPCIHPLLTMYPPPPYPVSTPSLPCIQLSHLL